jgi:membrane-associated phospholipid phosphatase
MGPRPTQLVLATVLTIFFFVVPVIAQLPSFGSLNYTAGPASILRTVGSRNPADGPVQAIPLRLSSSVSPVGGVTELSPFENLGNNFLDAFKGGNLYLHLTAVASTCLLVAGGVDYDVEHYSNTHPDLGSYGRGVFITGQYLPFIAGGSLLMYAGATRNKEALGASFAVIQASLLELMYNTALKAITGRPGPDWRHNADMESLSKTFRFGLLRGGVFWGWPSGHTAATMAVVSSLIGYYPNSTWLKVAGFSLVAYTIFAVSIVNRGGMHWFSDAIAAALMSYAIGSTVGKYYRGVYNSLSLPPAGPLSSTSPSATPMSVGFSFHF